MMCLSPLLVIQRIEVSSASAKPVVTFDSCYINLILIHSYISVIKPIVILFLVIIFIFIVVVVIRINNILHKNNYFLLFLVWILHIVKPLFACRRIIAASLNNFWLFNFILRLLFLYNGKFLFSLLLSPPLSFQTFIYNYLVTH